MAHIIRLTKSLAQLLVLIFIYVSFSLSLISLLLPITDGTRSNSSVTISIPENNLELIRIPISFKSDFLLNKPDLDPKDLEFEYIGRITPMPYNILSGIIKLPQPLHPMKTGTIFHVFLADQSIKDIPFQEWDFNQNSYIDTRKTNQTLMANYQDLEAQYESIVFPLDILSLVKFIDPSKRTIFIVGGFLDQAPKKWQIDMAKAWREFDDVNVIIVGWNNANKWQYQVAVSNTRIVSRQISVFLYYLAQAHGLDFKSDQFLNNIHLVGHSLGAHICGFVGHDFAGRVGRITGLDAAGPYFSDLNDQFRLDRSDAQLVEALHTNGRYEYSIFYGILKHVGHIDYYPNGGQAQPGCPHPDPLFKWHHEIVRDYYTDFIRHAAHLSRRNNQKLRLLAFPSCSSYEDFSHGLTFVNYCPSIAFDSNLNDIDVNHNLNACSIPIDFTSPIEELKEELTHNHGFDFRIGSDNLNLYFNTRDNEPFLSDHHLFKMQLFKTSQPTYASKNGESPSSAPATPSASASASASSPLYSENSRLLEDTDYTVKLSFKMANGINDSKTVVNYKLIEKGRMYHIVVPFEATSHESKYALVELDSNNYFIDEPIRLMENLEEIFPSKIDISISHQPTRMLRSVSSKAREWVLKTVGLGLSQEEQESCKAMVYSIRIQPLSSLKKLLMAIYRVRDIELGDPKPRIINLKGNKNFPMSLLDDHSSLCFRDDIPEMKIELELDIIVIDDRSE